MSTVDRQSQQAIPTLPPLIKYGISALIFVLGIGGMIGLSVLRKQPETQATDFTTPLVTTVEAIEFDGQLELTVSGQVVPYRETQVATQVSGIIASKSECTEVGNFVTQGDTLLTIDQENLLLDKQRLDAELGQSEAILAELKVEKLGAERDIDLAKEEVALLNLDRDRKLALRGSVSQTAIDQTERNLIIARKTLQSLENNYLMMHARETRLQSGINLVQASLKRVELDISRTTITAPISGVIVSVPVEQGDYLMVGGAVATINDTTRVEVECSLRLDQLEWLIEHSSVDLNQPEDAFQLPRTPVEIVTNQGADAGVWRGELSRYDGMGLDQRTKTVPVRIDVREPVVETARGLRALVQNSLVKVKIKIETNHGQQANRFLAFPASAIQPGNYIWVVENGCLKKCHVRIVNQRAGNGANGTRDLVVVLMDSELKVGDKVVVSPVTQPIVGAKVREVNAS